MDGTRGHRHLRGADAGVEGQRETVVAELRRALALTESPVEMRAWAASLRLGRLVGGDEGAALERRALDVMRARGVRDPERWASIYYWRIRRDILDRQESEGWGARVIDRLSRDLGHAFPGMQGFSPRNLKYMRAFAAAWPDETIVQRVVARLPWGHNVRLLDRAKDREVRLWYAQRALEHGWSRTVLEVHLESRLHARAGKALTNFRATLPSPQSDIAQATLKDPYLFDFLTLGPDAQERDLERGLLDHVRDFLLELGVGFAFVGSQVHIEVGNEDFYLDLLFFHLKLRCFVVIDLKMGAFKPAYRLLEKLPTRLKGSLPSVEEIEAELRAGGRKRR